MLNLLHISFMNLSCCCLSEKKSKVIDLFLPKKWFNWCFFLAWLKFNFGERSSSYRNYSLYKFSFIVNDTLIDNWQRLAGKRERILSKISLILKEDCDCDWNVAMTTYRSIGGRCCELIIFFDDSFCIIPFATVEHLDFPNTTDSVWKKIKKKFAISQIVLSAY